MGGGEGGRRGRWEEGVGGRRGRWEEGVGGRRGRWEEGKVHVGGKGELKRSNQKQYRNRVNEA